MKLLMMIPVLLFSSTSVYPQLVNLDLKNAPVEQAFKEISLQTGYQFIYTRSQLEKTQPVTLALRNSSLQKALDLCLLRQPLTYHLENRYVVIRDKTAEAKEKPSSFTIYGTVTGENGLPLAGAEVRVKEGNKTAVCDDNGQFQIEGLQPGNRLIATYLGYVSREVEVKQAAAILIELQPFVNSLDETLVVAYGTTTRRLNTGSVSRLPGRDIEKQPVSNILAALHGRIPGLQVTQQSGIPGSAVSLQLRGRTSINSNINNDPLIIIDGVPFAPNNSPVNQVGSALGSTGLSPFNAINPSDIESIEVLKDADATAIYGSRGANGVILITTRKGRAGKTTLQLDVHTGFSRVTRSMDFLTTPQYLAMRREAFANDGIVPNATTGRAATPAAFSCKTAAKPFGN